MHHEGERIKNHCFKRETHLILIFKKQKESAMMNPTASIINSSQTCFSQLYTHHCYINMDLCFRKHQSLTQPPHTMLTSVSLFNCPFQKVFLTFFLFFGYQFLPPSIVGDRYYNLHFLQIRKLRFREVN